MGISNQVTTVHNLLQTIAWYLILFFLVVSVLQDCQGTIFSVHVNNQRLVKLYQAVQTAQIFEVFYAIIGW